MTNGFKDDSGKFHPINNKKGVRKSRDQKAKTQGVKIRKRKEGDTVVQILEKEDREVNDPIERQQILDQLSRAERDEWETVVGSQVVMVKHEMMDGRPVISIRFANGEEWFEFESFTHQEEFIKENKIKVDESITGEFVEIDHPDIAGFITMESGSILFGEREGSVRKSRGSMTEILPTQGRANVKLNTSGRGNRGTQYTLAIGNQLSDIGIWNVSQTGQDQIESTITDASRQANVNSKDDMFKLSRMLQSIIEERIEDGDIS